MQKIDKDRQDLCLNWRIENMHAFAVHAPQRRIRWLEGHQWLPLGLFLPAASIFVALKRALFRLIGTGWP